MSEFRLGIRVGDVPAAAAFYGGLGSRRKAPCRDRTASRCSRSSAAAASTSWWTPSSGSRSPTLTASGTRSPGREPADATGAVRESWFGAGG